ncbi:MAG TPA: hypothetical protein VNW30_05280 [Opitutaceae bacterium]|jgi:hypothetical protein|nr:hypothetical protein [Opitutaceae bacterium]
MSQKRQIDRYEKVLWLARLNARFGSLWWAEEELWRNYLESYVGAQDRDGHPGVSVRSSELKSYFEKVPLLFGRTAKYGETGPILACLRPDNPTHLTVFGTMLNPAQIWVAEFDGRIGVARVRRWIHKWELDIQEKRSLSDWYQRNLNPI